MPSKTYVICWDGCIDNCLDIESQLSKTDLDYVVYNVSSKDVESDRWIRTEDIRYYRHFHNSLIDFAKTEHKVFISNSGDPEYDNYGSYTKYIEALFESDNNIGLYAPSFDYDSFSGSGSRIRFSKKYQNMYLSTMTNGIFLAMSREIAMFVLDFMNWLVDENKVDLSVMKSGWGLDLAYNSYAIYIGKNIYRDNLVIHHPTGSSYPHSEANKEMLLILNNFNMFCGEKGLDVNRLATIQDLTFKKVQNGDRFDLKYEELYGIDLE
jgi:hypothetical protein